MKILEPEDWIYKDQDILTWKWDLRESRSYNLKTDGKAVRNVEFLHNSYAVSRPKRTKASILILFELFLHEV